MSASASIRSVDVIAARDARKRRRPSVSFGSKVLRTPPKMHSPPSPHSAVPRKPSMIGGLRRGPRKATPAIAPEKKRVARKKKAAVATPKAAVATRKAARKQPGAPKADRKRRAGRKADRKRRAGRKADRKRRAGRKVDFTKIRWGTFTPYFKAWRKRAIRRGGAAGKKAARMKNLKQFSVYILANPSRFPLRIRRKARFYLNIVLKGGKRAPRPVKFTPERKRVAKRGKRVAKRGKRVAKRAA
jgi:hypothetical protein